MTCISVQTLVIYMPQIFRNSLVPLLLVPSLQKRRESYIVEII